MKETIDVKKDPSPARHRKQKNDRLGIKPGWHLWAPYKPSSLCIPILMKRVPWARHPQFETKKCSRAWIWARYRPCWAKVCRSEKTNLKKGCGINSVIAEEKYRSMETHSKCFTMRSCLCQRPLSSKYNAFFYIPVDWFLLVFQFLKLHVLNC